MAVQAGEHPQRQQIASIVQQWEARLRWTRALRWLPRSLAPGLLIGLAAAFFSRGTPALSDTQVVLLTLIGTLGGAALMFGVILLRRRSATASAQRFDLRFGLYERVSTAIELLEGRIAGDPGLAAHQVSDALTTAQQVDHRQRLPYRINWREWLALVLIAVMLAIVLLLIPRAGAQSAEDAAREAVIAQAEDAVREQIQNVSSDTNLRDDDRQQLLQALQSSLETLRDEGISTEEAFATLSEVEQALSEQSQQMQQQAAAQQAALAQALEEMRTELSPELSDVTGEDMAAALRELAEMLEQMTPEQLQQLQDALNQAAESMMNSDPALAEQLRQAMEQLGEMDPAAREALENLARQIQQAQTSQQQSQQQMQESAERFRELQEQLAQGQNPPESSQGQSDQEQGSQASEQGEGQPGQDEGGSAPGASENSQAGQGTTGSTAGEGGGQDESEQGALTAAGRGSEGAGDGQGDLSVDAGGSSRGEGGDPDTSEDNNPDGEGVGEYEAIFAPRSERGMGDDEVRLESDPGDTPVSEGEFSANPSGEARVPYNEVFSDYADAANHALESDYIPLGLRDVIRLYFTSLEPRR
jgi:septal ring factor EnvC (AmiA/AmiB activator)